MATFKEISSKTWDFYQRHRLLMNFVLLSIVYMICCVWSVGVYFALVLLSYLTFSEKNYGGIYYLIYSLPFVCVLVIGQYGYVVPIIAVIFVIYAFIRVFIVEKSKINIVSFIGLLLLEIYLALPINEYATIGFLKMAAFLLIFMLFEVAREKCRLIDLKIFLYSFILGLLVSTMFGIMFASSPIIVSFTEQYHYNERLRISGTLSNPNMLAIFCLLSTTFSAYLVLSDKNRIINLILFILSFIFGILTLSKTFLVLSILIIFFVILKLFLKSPKKALIILGCFLVVFGFAYVCFTDFVQSLVSRFFSSTKFDDIKTFNWSEFLTFRNDLWGVYLTKVFESPHNVCFGVGLGHDTLPGYLFPHNVYIELLFQMGIVGLLLVVVFILYMIFQVYKSASRTKPVDWFLILPILIIAIIMFVS